MKRRSGSLPAAPLLAVAAMLAGCASFTYPPVQPIPSLATIAGKWSGTIDYGDGPQLFYLTINPDGSLVATGGTATNFGKVALDGGKASFEIYPNSSGVLQYLEGGGRRMILLNEQFGAFTAQVTPLS